MSIQPIRLTPNQTASEAYTVTVAGQPVPVEFEGGVHIARWIAAEPADVRIDTDGPVGDVRISPASRDVQPSHAKSSVELTAPAAGAVWIETTGRDPLVLLADPPVESVPEADGANVTVFGPGEHDVGLLELQDGQTLFLAAGAVVYGGLIGSPKDVAIVGRGVLDAGRLERPHKAIELVEARNVLVDGIVVRNSPCWTTAPMWCENVAYRNVKIFSNGRNGDGIDVVASRNVTIENCFFRCTDDCISLKSHVDPRFLSQSRGVENAGNIENVRVTGCVMVGWSASDGFTVGFESRGDYTRNIHVSDCDVIYARGDNHAGGHSAFSLICDGPTTISEVVFENMRVEETVLKNFDIFITDGQKYTMGDPGHVHDVVIRNCHWDADRPILLRGHDGDHRVRGVRFEGCTVAGKPLTAPDAADVQINEFVDDVTFG
ncbi:MAG: glycosyl hydrolase family 28 protein [Phycisphaerae bacterium]